MIELLSHNLMRFHEALEYVEKSRSRGLVELLALSTMMPPSEGEAAITANERALAMKIRVLQGMLRISKNEAQHRILLLDLSTARELHALKLSALEEEYPEYTSLRRKIGRAHV